MFVRLVRQGPIIILLLVLGWATALRLSHIEVSPYPFSLDPYFHMADSAAIAETGRFSSVTPYDVEASISGNHHLLPLLGASVIALGGDPLTFYRYATLVIVIGIGWLWFAILRRFFSPWAAVIGAGAYLAFPYVSHRTILTLPENLNVLFLLAILLVISRWLTQSGAKGERFRWRHSPMNRTLGLLALLFGLSYFTHPTASVGVLIVATIGFLSLIQKRQWWLVAGAGMIGLMLLWFGLPMIPGVWAWQLPAWSTIQTSFTGTLFILGLIGWGGMIVLAGRGRLAHWPLLLGVSLPILLVWLFYQGVPGVIEPERWLIFVGWPLVLGLSWLVDTVCRWPQRFQPFQVATLAALLILPLMTQPSRPWPQAFTDDEVAAEETMRTKLPEDGLYISQPILEWLIRGVGQRRVIWDGYRGAALLRDQSLVELAALGSQHEARWVLLVFSRSKNDPNEQTLFSDGHLEDSAFGDQFRTPGIEEAKFSCLPKVLDNGGVVIYELALTETRPDCRITPTPSLTVAHET